MTPQRINTASKTANSPHSAIKKILRVFGFISGT